ncbi:hypothetical protein [Clostridium estertheticum]|uniref:hypothetical protein n=1 Tax=Clostridium estertheticum TaxID=238834 RepID=UPI001396946D|nr:hypothetical protein [Clostridium estertheticum]
MKIDEQININIIKYNKLKEERHFSVEIVIGDNALFLFDDIFANYKIYINADHI